MLSREACRDESELLICVCVRTKVPTHTCAKKIMYSHEETGARVRTTRAMHRRSALMSLLWQVVLLEERVAPELLFFDFCNHFSWMHGIIENTVKAHERLFDRYLCKRVTVR